MIRSFRFFAFVLGVILASCTVQSLSAWQVGVSSPEKVDDLSVPKIAPKPLAWIEDADDEKGVEKRSKAAKSLNSLANRLKASGRYEEAEKAYRAAMEADPSWSFPPYQLACNYELAGDHERATDAFALAMKLGFDDFPTALQDDELGKIRDSDSFEASLQTIRSRYIKAGQSRVGQPLAVRPAGKQPTKGWPVMVLLHGYGDSNLSYLDNAREWAKLGFLVIALPGSVPAADGRFMWSDDSTDQTQADIDAAIASPLLDGVIDRKQINLLGFSQGALHAILLGCATPGKYAGVVALSPGGSLAGQLRFPRLNRAEGESRLFFIHGTDEPHAPYVNLWRDAYQKAGWKFDSATHEGGHHFPQDWESMRNRVAGFLR